jgi:hypothetical protein
MAENNWGKQEKKVIFYDTDKRHAELKIRLQHDKLTQSSFFRMMVTGYLANDLLILDYIEKYKEENNIQSKEKRKKTRKAIEDGHELERVHGLKAEEVENIFDMIEQEHPEL